MNLLTGLTATPVFTVDANAFQPIIDTLTSLVTTAVPVIITVSGIWMGVRFLKRTIKSLGQYDLQARAFYSLSLFL